MLECQSCSRTFSQEDIAAGCYFLQTMTCGFCYAKMQAQPYEKSCFGKPTTILFNGKRLLGYDPEAEECDRWCMDRFLCRELNQK